MDKKIGGYNSINDNNSKSQSEFSPTPGKNIYSQENNNLYSQNNGNNYQQPHMYIPTQNNYMPPQTNPSNSSPELNGGTYPKYGEQINVNVNTNVTPIYLNDISPQANTTPLNSNNIGSTFTAPLIPSSNEIIVKKNCFSNDISNEKLNSGKNFCTIFLGGMFFIVCLMDTIIGSQLENINHDIFVSFDISLFCINVLVFVSILRIKCLRYTVTALVFIFFVGGIVITIIEYGELNNIKSTDDETNKNNQKNQKPTPAMYKVISIIKLILLFLILLTFVQNYLGIIICKCFNKVKVKSSTSRSHGGRRHRRNLI